MVTTAQRHKLNKRPLKSAILTLIEVQEDGNATVHRAVANNEDIVHNGDTFTRSDLRVTLPTSGNEETVASATIDNTTRIPGRAILSRRNKIGVRLIVVDSDAPDDVVKVDSKNLLVINDGVVEDTVDVNLTSRMSLDEPWPPQRVDKLFPGGRFRA